MNGKSHQKIAMLSYAIVSTIPAINSIPLFNNKYIHIPMGISLIGLITAGIAGLIVDADSQHSKISHMNPLTRTNNAILDHLESFLRFLLRLLLGLGFGALILWYSKAITTQLTRIKYIGEYAQIYTYLIAFFVIVFGITTEKGFKRLPIIGLIYKRLASSLRKIADKLKRITMFLTYAGSSLILSIYNYTNAQDINIYLICILLICIAVFPHRSFLHSIEGVIIFTISASYIFNKLAFGYLTGCFFIGYISHIYWADIFTKEGVPILSTPRFIAAFFKKLGLKNNFIHLLEKIGDFKLKLPPHITTGSALGNLFEVIYIIILFLILIIGFNVYGGQFKLTYFINDFALPTSPLRYLLQT